MRILIAQVALLSALAASVVLGQSGGRPTFEVATIKPSSGSQRYGQSGGPGTDSPTVFTMTNYPLSAYVRLAYQLDSKDRYAGLEWMDKVNFDLVAKVRPGATRTQLRLMLQSLLEERFMLKTHLENRQQPAYRLSVRKGGHKLRLTAQQSKSLSESGAAASERKLDAEGFPIIPEQRGIATVRKSGTVHLRAYAQTTEEIAGMLSGELGRRVVDGTGLRGRYDFTLAFDVAASAGIPGTSGAAPGLGTGVTVIGAVQQQLGLVLDQTKVMVDVVVIDSAARTPTSN